MKLTFPWLSDDYVSDWARTMQPGAGKDRGAMVIPEVGDEVLVAFEQQDPQRPYVLGGLYNGIDTPSSKGPKLIDSGSGAVNRRSLVSRNGHRIDLLDENGKTEGHHRRNRGREAEDLPGLGWHQNHGPQRRKVLIEGKKGIVVDAATSNLELKGKKISITATNGVAMSGGAGAVDVDTQKALSLNGTTVKVAAKAAAQFQAGGPNVITGAPVKIN